MWDAILVTLLKLNWKATPIFKPVVKMRPHQANPHYIHTYTHPLLSFLIRKWQKPDTVMTWPLPAEVSILAITEFYSANTTTPTSYPEYRWLRSPKQEVTMCSGLIRWPFLRILLYLAHAAEGDLCHNKKTKPIFKLGRLHRAIISNLIKSSQVQTSSNQNMYTPVTRSYPN